MPVQFEIDDSGAYAKMEGADERVMSRFAELLRPIEQEMVADARARAEAHFHSVGKKPGAYLAAFDGGVKKRPSGVVGWVKNSNPLAHLLEYGFTISDLLINASGVMKFDAGGVGELYRRAVHRHETRVQAYPAVRPAVAAHLAEVREAAQTAAEGG